MTGRDRPPVGAASGQDSPEDEERYRAFVENSTEGIWRFDLEPPVAVDLSEQDQIDAFYRFGFLAEANDAFAQMYGYERGDEMQGLRLDELFLRGDPINENYLRTLIRSRYRLIDAETVEKDRAGGVKHFSNTLTGIVRDGMLARIWGTQRDITAQREAERRASELSSRLRFITENTPLLISYIDAGLRYRFVNHSYGEWFGLPAGEIVGKTVPEVIGPDAFESVRSSVEKTLAGNRVTYTGWLTLPDGKDRRFIRADLIPDFAEDAAAAAASGEPPRGYIAALTDLTQQRKAAEEREHLLAEQERLLAEQARLLERLEHAHERQQESLHESEERFRLLVEGVRDYAIFMLDPFGNIATWNAGAQRFMGYTANEIIGKHFSTFYTPEDIARRHPWKELEIAADEGRYEEEGWRIRKDGTRFWSNVLITALRDEQGHLRGFGKVTRDMTDRRLREQERAIAQALEQQRRFLKDVLASVTNGRLRLCDTTAELPPPAAAAPYNGVMTLATETLKAVRRRVSEVAGLCGMPRDIANDLLTAASECAMNAVVHAGGGTATVFGDPESGRVQVWVEDTGAGIDLSSLPRATLEPGYSTGGVGIGHGFSLMISCCQRVYLLTSGRGTTVVLEQSREAPEPSWLSMGGGGGGG